MARTAQIRKEKRQSIITLRHEGQPIRNISITFKVEMKLALMRTDTVKEDPELPLLQRTSSLELPVSEIAAQINALRSSSDRHISTSKVQRRLHESGLSWLNRCKETTSKGRQ